MKRQELALLILRRRVEGFNLSMMNASQEAQYVEIGKALDADISKMFGKPCLKVNGKAFAAFYQGEMVFKLHGLMHEKALSLEGARLWDPSGKNKPMKEWVQLPYAHHDSWKEFAEAAVDYVRK